MDRASLRCVASQPWLFPRSMMVGFIARVEAGAEAAPLRVDEAELQDAQWFERAFVRELPKETMLALRERMERWNPTWARGRGLRALMSP